MLDNDARAVILKKSLLQAGKVPVKDAIPEDLSIQEFLAAVKTDVMSWRTLVTYYNCAMMEIETKFRVLNEQFSLQYDRNPIETIKTRIKSPDSLIEKMVRKGYPLSISSINENVNDVAGVRVICSFPDDIYMLSECLIRQDDITLIEKKDYIETPKPSGYRGLHMIVAVPIFLPNEKRTMKVEVQLRTIAMDFWASLEHKLRYKKNLSDELSAELDSQLIDCAEQAVSLDRKMQLLRNKIDGNDGGTNTI